MSKIDSYVLRLCAELERNIADEAEARMGYYKIIENYEPLLYQSEIAQLNEIIAEELKHSEILRKMIYDRMKILPED